MIKRLLISVIALVGIFGVLALTSQRTLADSRDFVLINGTSNVTIQHAYIDPSTVDTWNTDYLGEGVALGPGNSLTITFTAYDGTACVYDIKVTGVDDAGAPAQGVLYNVNLCTTDTVTFS